MSAKMFSPSLFTGATAVAEYHMRRYFGVQLTEAQALSLWQELEADLIKIGLPETIKEAKEATSGSLDTLPRGDVLDAIARVLTAGAHCFPLNCSPHAEVESFIKAVREGIAAREYAFVAQE